MLAEKTNRIKPKEAGEQKQKPEQNPSKEFSLS